MSFWTALSDEVRDSNTLLIVLGLALVLVTRRRAGFGEHGRAKGPLLFGALHLALLPVVVWLRATDAARYRDVRLAFLLLGGLAAASTLTFLTFRWLLPRLRLGVPRIVEDVLTAITALMILLGIASRAGFNVTGVIATSAVLTAVIGLALQDTLGNIVGGLALQTDESIAVGDWIEVNGKQGRVTEIRWRYTAIETRDWETVIVPNSQLVKGQVVVLGRRRHQARQWRRHVAFNVDFRTPPDVVSRVVTEALLAAPLPSTAATPPPDCIFIRNEDSYARYEVRYFLTDLERDAPVDHEVMVRIESALHRAEIPLAKPARSLFLIEDGVARASRKEAEELAERRTALDRIPILRALAPGERHQLAEQLRLEAFAAGEALAHQGEPGEHLYLLRSGRVAVRAHTDGEARERAVAELGVGDFFGEMSLLTGEPRNASVIALERVEALRLEKSAFEALLAARPEIAEAMATELAERRAERDLALSATGDRPSQAEKDMEKSALLRRIQHFFSIRPT